jgi:hypothetical protein
MYIPHRNGLANIGFFYEKMYLNLGGVWYLYFLQELSGRRVLPEETYQTLY